MPSSTEFWGADRRNSDTWPDLTAGDREVRLCFSAACYSLAVGTPVFILLNIKVNFLEEFENP